MKKNFLFLICASLLCACSQSNPKPVPPGPEPEPVVTKYSVDYTYDAHVNWSGPASITEKTELRAAAIVQPGFLLDKSKITVTVADSVLDSNSYTYSSSVLIVPANFVTGKVVVTSQAYVDTRVAVDVQVSNTTNTFPSLINIGTKLEGTLIPDELYFLPETIVVKSGEDVLLPDGDYTYDIETGKVVVFEDSVTDKITISGEAPLKIRATFQVGDGSWDGESDIEDKFVDVRKGSTLYNAIQVGTIPTPSANKEGLYFKGWYNGGTLVNFGDALEGNVTLVAEYGEGVVNIAYDTNNIDLISAPQTVTVGSEINVTLSASEGYALPDEEHISVLKDGVEIEFTYTTEDYRSASISVDSTYTTEASSIITIAIDGYDSYTITFNPVGGEWEDGTTDSVIVSNIPLTSTYKDVFGQLEGFPSKEGKECANWKCNDKTLNKYQVIDGPAFRTLTAMYPTGTTFYSDSWADVISYANQGIDKLKEMYPEFADNFIGAERPIKIDNDVTAIARVIGINHDATISMDEITLTMEIDRIVTVDCYCATNSTTNRWADSQLRTKLNGEILSKLKDLNDGFDPKETQKNAIAGGGSETTSMTIDRLFPLSGTEIGLPSTSATGEYSYNQKEGSIYEFYATCSPEQRIKYSLDGNEPASYWLRSPLKLDSKNVFQILTDADYSIQDVATDATLTNGYMIAFAI